MTKDLNQVKEQLEKFKKTRKSLILGTIGKEGEPLASYSPYVEKDGKIYLYLSALSEHKENILNNKSVSVFYIEDESSAKMIAVRERLTYKGLGTLVEKETLEKEIQAMFVEEHGKNYETLPKMHGFFLIEVELGKGRYVFGFGNAYEIDGSEIKHINNK